MRWVMFLGLAVLLTTHAAADDWSHPTVYSQFDTSVSPGDGPALKAAIISGAVKYIYLQAGFYTLVNPVVISRRESLVIHGADQEHVILIAQDPTKPLFDVKDATVVQFANVKFRPDKSLQSSPIGILAETTMPSSIELINVGSESSRFEIRGPDAFLCEGCYWGQGGVANQLVVDHPDADALIVGGDNTNLRQEPKTPGPDDYHIWKKRGRLRVYGMSFEAANGRADIRIDGTSRLGPDVLADTRSEGSNGRDPAPYDAAHVYIPPGAIANAVLKNVSLAYTGPTFAQAGYWGYGTAVIENGGGTIWLLGVNGWLLADLVRGNAGAATIVAAGNATLKNTGQFPAGSDAPAALYLGDNVYDYRCNSGSGQPPWLGPVTRCNGIIGMADSELPKVRMWAPGQKLQSHPSVPAPPKDSVPHALSWPIMDVKLPGFLSVKDAPFSAVGDGKADDTAALQSALDYQCTHGRNGTYLYFPAGVYKTTRLLRFNAEGAACHSLPFGGSLAGAGADTVKLQRATPGGVFYSGGLGFFTIQGIEFDALDRSEPVIALEEESLSGQVGTQQDLIDHIRTKGGWAGIASGDAARDSIRSSVGCNSVLTTNSEIDNAHEGFVSGHMNALENICLGCIFQDNDYNLGVDKRPGQSLSDGGTVHCYDCTSKRTKLADFYQGSYTSSNTIALRGYTSDAPSLQIDRYSSLGGTWSVQWEQLAYRPTAPAAVGLKWGRGGSVIFLDSVLTSLRGQLISDNNATAILSLYSTIPDLPATSLIQPARHAPQAQIDEVKERGLPASDQVKAPSETAPGPPVVAL